MAQKYILSAQNVKWGLHMEWIGYKISEQILISEMFSLFKRHYEYGYNFSGETHDFWECVYVLDGSMCVSADERVYNLSRGEIIFHKPMELHKFHIEEKKGADLLIFSFSASGELTRFLQNKVFKLSIEQNEIVHNLSRYMDRFEKNGESATLYVERFNEKKVFSQRIATYIQMLILSLADSGRVSTVSHAADAVLFNKAVSYMNKNAYDKALISDIAQHCNISDAGIKRIFSKYAGMSVHKYFLKIKFKIAAELLEKGESVSTVSQILGFSSQAYFSKSFKREMGYYASEFRKQ